MIIRLDDDLVRAFDDWARKQKPCRSGQHPLDLLATELELQMGRDLVERKRKKLLAQGTPRDECPGCFSSIHGPAAKDGWCLDCKHQQPLIEKWWKEAHKRMTLEEYMELDIVGWHKVCKNIDGIGGVGVQYLPQMAENTPIVRPGKERRGVLEPKSTTPKPNVRPGPQRLPITEQKISMPPVKPPRDKDTVVCPDCGAECKGPGYPMLHSCRESRQPHPNKTLEINELLRRSLENFKDDIEERPMRHSIGNLIARIETVLGEKEDQ